MPLSCSAICCSPAPIKVSGSTSHNIRSTSFNVFSATLTIYSPSLFLALWIPGVSRNTIWPSSHVYTVCILFLVVCGFFDVIAIFWPIIWFINVDFPTFGLPIRATNPDLNFSFIILLHPLDALLSFGKQMIILFSSNISVWYF